MATGEAFKKIRLKIGLNQIELARILGCTQSAISKYESGAETPSLKIAKKLIIYAKSKKIKIKLEDIFPDE